MEGIQNRCCYDDPPVLTPSSNLEEALSLFARTGMSELLVVDKWKKAFAAVGMIDCIECLKQGVNLDQPVPSYIMKKFTDLSTRDLIGSTNQPGYIIDESSKRVIGWVRRDPCVEQQQAKHPDMVEMQRILDTYNLCFDSVSEGITLVNSQGIIEMMNESYARYIGISKEAAIGRYVGDVIDKSRLPVVLETGVPELNQIHTFNGRNTVVHRKPIWQNGRVIGAVGMLVHEGISEVYKIIERMEEQHQKKSVSGIDKRNTVQRKELFEEIIGDSPAISHTRNQALKAARTIAPILITGESGVGKEKFARAIHQAGIVKNGPFIAVNCAAIPEHLLESELFGYDDGAFTGAKKNGKPGKFEMAHNGTLFLDEIGDMPMTAQVKILRALQEKEVVRIGGIRAVPVRFRLITATNKDLRKLIRQGDFREDLYHRIHVIPLEIPPLRQRKQDIPLLTAEFISHICRSYQLEPYTVDKAVLRQFFQYEWPGNVRELMNILERMVVLSEKSHLRLEDIPEELRYSQAVKHETSLRKRNIIMNRMHEDEEKGIIKKVLEEVNGNKSKAAELLGVSRATLYNKLSRWNV